MADISDVENALVAFVGAAAYPQGFGSLSVGGCPIVIYPGWPNPTELDKGMRSGSAHISIFSSGKETITYVAPENSEWIEINGNANTGNAIRIVDTQERTYQITIWAGKNKLRDMVAKPIDLALRKANKIAFPDFSPGTLRYRNSIQDDSQQKTNEYRRDIFVTIEYSTIEREEFYRIKKIDIGIAAVADVSNPDSPILGEITQISIP